jgi:GT2 family glycosyltransferase/glycosyltransferase involved in cell wall biosynthesis
MPNYLTDFCRDPKKYLKYLYPSSLRIAAEHVWTQRNFRIGDILNEIYTYQTKRRKRKEAIPMAGDRVMGALRYFLQVKWKQFLVNVDARMILPKQEAPLVSILLVLFNKAEYTYQCLETILAHADLPYEVVIVDNASSDGTAELLNRIDNATIIRNDDNFGFLKACNQGAQHARGRWLLLLNNDTQVLPGLLSKLVETAGSAERCGAVGGKLIFPNGTLQEAGSIIWNDGSCLGYGRGDNPDRPEYSYVKEVDYCSGACLLVNRELFEQVGGFDELYYPAYYEETDLCMNIRKSGYRVLFQPAAKLIHYEFGSAGSSSRAIELQVRNREKFADKWRAELAGQMAAQPGNILAARERCGATKRVLVLEDRVPDPTLGSGFPRIYEIITIMVELGLKAAVFPLVVDERPEPWTFQLQQLGVEVFYATETLDYTLPKLLRERRDFYDYIWVSRPNNMKRIIDLLNNLCPGTPIIYDAEALFSPREILQCEIEGRPLDEDQKEKKIHTEIDLIKKANQIVTVSERERDLVRRYTASGTIHVLGHTCTPNPTPNPFQARKDILFVGGFLESPCPNEDAVLHFVKRIFPLIREKIGARLWIVGTNNLDSIKGLASEEIVVTGRVESLFEYYNRCRVFVVPTRYAAGIPLKLQECITHGLPAVATPLIAEQLGLGEETLLVGHSPEEFAAKVVKCYTDEPLWNRLRENGLAYIKRECSPARYKSAIREIFA